MAGFFYFRTQPSLTRGRRWLLFGLRTLSLCILLLLLLSPIIYYLRHMDEKQQILVLNDISASMDLGGGKTAKKDMLRNPGKQMLDAYSEAGYEVVSYNFADGLEGVVGNTQLSPVLGELAKKHDFNRVKGILLLSDGWFRDAELRQVRQLGCPFIALADTIVQKQADLSVAKTVTNRHAYRGEPFLVRAELRSENYIGPATVQLKLGTSVVASKSVQLQAGANLSADLTHTFAQTGLYSYSVSVSAAGISERSLNNNSYPGAIDVLSDKQQIVVISDSPAWDNKFIVDTIAENTRWEVRHYRIQGDRILLGETAVPALPDANLAAVVLVNNGSLQLPAPALSYVLQNQRKGVGILFQGLPLAELNSILPLQRSNVLTPYQGFLELAPSAAAYPMMNIDSSELSQIPPLDYYYASPAQNAEILATINNPQSSPGIAIRVSSGGKVLALAFLNLWKWQLQSGGGGYRKFLSNALTWLANTSEGGFNAIYNSSYFLGENIDLRLSAEDDIRSLRLDLNPEIRVYDSDNKEAFRDFLTQSDGEYSVGIRLDKAGQYRFEISDQVSGEKSSGRFNVAESTLETRDFDFNLPLLSWLAADTGGRVVSLGEASGFKPLPAQNRKLELRLDFPIYRKWWVLALFIGAFCLELFFRRRWGLL